MNELIKERELKSCGTVKAIMMLTVLVCHCASASASSTWFAITAEHSSPVIEFLACITGRYHVNTFIFVSGYLFYYLKYELGKYSDSLKFIKKKALRLLAPYVFACLWVVPAYWYFYRPSLSELIKKYLLGESPSQLWFLFTLFWIYIGFYLLSKILDRFSFFEKMNGKTAAAGLVFFYLLSFASPVSARLGIPNPNVFQIFTAFQYSIFFFAGFIFRKLDFSFLYKAPWLMLIVSLGVTSVYYLCGEPARPFIRLLLDIFNSVSVFVFISRYVNPKGKVFGILKKYSFQIYLIHQQAIYLIVFLSDRFAAVYPVTNFVACLIGSLLISLAFSELFSKFRFTRNILGIKNKI